jgi:hypothetical protein
MKHFYFTRYRGGAWYQIPVGIYRLKRTIAEANPVAAGCYELLVRDQPNRYDRWPLAVKQKHFAPNGVRCVCRTCGTPARACPKDSRRWACPSCEYDTYNASMLFIPETDYVASKLPRLFAEGARLVAPDSPDCDVCGSITVRVGGCYKCLNCGTSMAAGG